jgi:hypothetical protein
LDWKRPKISMFELDVVPQSWMPYVQMVLFIHKRKYFQCGNPLSGTRCSASVNSGPRAPRVELKSSSCRFPLESHRTHLAVGPRGLIVCYRTRLLHHPSLIKFLKLCYFGAPTLGNNCPVTNTGSLWDKAERSSFQLS